MVTAPGEDALTHRVQTAGLGMEQEAAAPAAPLFGTLGASHVALAGKARPLPLSFFLRRLEADLLARQMLR